MMIRSLLVAAPLLLFALPPRRGARARRGDAHVPSEPRRRLCLSRGGLPGERGASEARIRAVPAERLEAPHGEDRPDERRVSRRGRDGGRRREGPVRPHLSGDGLHVRGVLDRRRDLDPLPGASRGAAAEPAAAIAAGSRGSSAAGARGARAGGAAAGASAAGACSAPRAASVPGGAASVFSIGTAPSVLGVSARGPKRFSCGDWVVADEPHPFDILPSGQALGSKLATAPVYAPGACQVSGGEPGGQALPADPTTFCCLP